MPEEGIDVGVTEQEMFSSSSHLYLILCSAIVLCFAANHHCQDFKCLMGENLILLLYFWKESAFLIKDMQYLFVVLGELK